MNTEITQIGIKRQVDKLGRIVIPKEYREFFHIDCEDEVFVIGDKNGIYITNPKYKVVEIKENNPD